MTKVLYQFTLLGLASSCLMSAAYANSDCGECEDDTVIFTQEPDFGNIACGATGLPDVQWTIKNIDTSPVQLGDIIIENFDDFPDTLVALLTPVAGDCALLPGDELAPGASCNIGAEINTTGIECTTPDDFFSLPTTGPVTRNLNIELLNAQRELNGPIDFAMTFTGSAEDFSVIGDNICGADDSADCDSSLMAQNAATIYLHQNAGTSVVDGHLTDEIFFVGDAQAYTTPGDVMQAADANLQAAYNNFLALSTYVLNMDPSALTTCNVLPADYFQGTNRMLTGGVYCINGSLPDDEPVGAPAVFDSVVTVYGKDPIVLIIDFTPPDLAIEAAPVLTFDGATFVFDEATEANPENIYWVVNGGVTMNTCGGCPISADDSADLAGTLMINGNFVVDADSGPGFIQGRILALKNQGDVTFTDNFTVTP